MKIVPNKYFKLLPEIKIEILIDKKVIKSVTEAIVKLVHKGEFGLRFSFY
jgi:nitrogen regulatory protein PII